MDKFSGRQTDGIFLNFSRTKGSDISCKVSSVEKKSKLFNEKISSSNVFTIELQKKKKKKKKNNAKL